MSFISIKDALVNTKQVKYMTTGATNTGGYAGVPVEWYYFIRVVFDENTDGSQKKVDIFGDSKEDRDMVWKAVQERVNL